MSLSTTEQIQVCLFNIIDGMNPGICKALRKRKGPEYTLIDATLEELGIGGDPIGSGELLELKDRIERCFCITFTNEELPESVEAQKLTFGQLVEVVQKKVT